MENRGREAEIVHLLRAVVADLGLLDGEFAARSGMHPTDVRALVCLMDAARVRTPLTAGLLGTRLGLNSAGTTALLDRLERLGHISRVRDARDRRRVLIKLDPRALALGRSFLGPLVQRATELLADYDERELAAVRGFLQGVRTAAAEHAIAYDAGPPPPDAEPSS